MIKGIVSGHIYKDDKGDKDIEILTFVNNDEWEAFDDISSALVECVETGDSEDYWFVALVEAEFTKTETCDGTEYDVDYTVKEIKDAEDLSLLSTEKRQPK